MRSPGRPLALAAAVAAVVLVGCGTGPDEVAAPAPTATVVPGAADPVPVVVERPGRVDVHGEQGLPDDPPPPDDSPTARADAVAVAEQAMRLFARPTVDETTWWAELRPLMSTAGARAYAYVDPATVPASAMTGPAVIAEGADPRGWPYLARVDVPTDQGTYQLLLVRQAAGDPWAVERIDPPLDWGGEELPDELFDRGDTAPSDDTAVDVDPAPADVVVPTGP